MFFRKAKKEKFWKPEYEALAQYNAEVGRRIAHTPEWRKKMARLQAEYDKRQREFAEKEGTAIIEI